MTAALIVPLCPLLTVLLVIAGNESTRRLRVKIGAWPLAVALLGALFTLYVVATSGPISIRFYEPAEGSALPVPIGFHIDRLSAVMMVLISAIGTMTVPADLDTTSTIFLALMHVALVPVTILGLHALRSTAE